MNEVLTFYRGTNNPHEPNLVASGIIQQSYNQVSWQSEEGLSVKPCRAEVDSKYLITYKVVGVPLKTKGSDGEVLLDIKTVRIPL